MEDQLAVRGRPLHGLVVTNVAADNLDAEGFERRRILFRKDQGANATFLVSQPLDEMAADETRGASNENIHAKGLPSEYIDTINS